MPGYLNGIVNPNCLCYMIAILQQLNMMPLFRAQIINAPAVTNALLLKCKSWAIIPLLQDLFLQLNEYQEDGEEIDIYDLCETIAVLESRKLEDMFKQQDAYDFLLVLMKHLGQCTPSNVARTTSNNSTSSLNGAAPNVSFTSFLTGYFDNIISNTATVAGTAEAAAGLRLQNSCNTELAVAQADRGRANIVDDDGSNSLDQTKCRKSGDKGSEKGSDNFDSETDASQTPIVVRERFFCLPLRVTTASSSSSPSPAMPNKTAALTDISPPPPPLLPPLSVSTSSEAVRPSEFEQCDNLLSSLRDLTKRESVLFRFPGSSNQSLSLRQTRIRSTPRYLLVLLKRFTFNTAHMRKEKLRGRFEFPISFDMTPFLEPTAVAGQENLKQSQPQPPLSNYCQYLHQSHLYKLSGIVTHRGSTASSGHYKSYIRLRTAKEEIEKEENSGSVDKRDKRDGKSKCDAEKEKEKEKEEKKKTSEGGGDCSSAAEDRWFVFDDDEVAPFQMTTTFLDSVAFGGAAAENEEEDEEEEEDDDEEEEHDDDDDDKQNHHEEEHDGGRDLLGEKRVAGPPLATMSTGIRKECALLLVYDRIIEFECE